MNYWPIMLAFAGFYAIHFALSMWQMQDFSRTYTRLRSQGLVVIGKHQNLFSYGAIVLFLIDNHGHIREGSYLTGVTVFSRFRTLSRFDGVNILDINTDDKQFPKAVQRALVNAAENYRVHLSGQVPHEPPRPLTRLAAKFSRPQRVQTAS